MLIIDNQETQNDYAPALTLESPYGGRLVYVVANQSARVQYKPVPDTPHAAIADWQPPEGLLLTPQSSFIDKIAGVRFKTEVAGSPARIVAQLSEPGDILPASGTPFTGALAAGGAVAGAGLTTVGGAECTAALALGAAFADIPGCSLNFSVVGAQASILVFQTIDFEVTAAAAGSIYLARFVMDGTPFGGQAIYIDSGVAAQRLTVMQHTVLTPIASGGHTLKLQGQRAAGAGGCRCNVTHTRVGYTLVDG